MDNKQTLVLIYGGKSSEHEVSLQTAFSIMEAIDYDQYKVIPIYIQLDGTWVEGNGYRQPAYDVHELRLHGKKTVSVFELAQKADVFFPVVHGPYGEDGTLQGMLEMMDVPYVGSGVLGSATAMDKVMMKKILGMSDLLQCKFLAYSWSDVANQLPDLCAQIERELGYPCFVKPANLGSSVGISKAKDEESLQEALKLAARYDRKLIVEEMVNGRELEIGVLGNKELQTSVVGEIHAAGEFYDYAAKYKNIGTELDIPAKIPESVARRISDMAKRGFSALECSGLSRVDFFWDEKKDQVFINEVNTMPGFTPFSMYPMLFQEAGISYSQLINELVELAFRRYAEKRQNQVTAEKLE